MEDGNSWARPKLTAEQIAGGLPQNTEPGQFSQELLDAAKKYFSVVHKQHDIMEHQCTNVVKPDNRSAGWSGHGKLQPGAGLFLVAKAINDRAENPETYGNEGIRLQVNLQHKARKDPAFQEKLQNTALLSLYQEDIEDAPKQLVANNDEIQKPSAALPHLLAKAYESIASDMGVELAPVDRSLGGRG